MATSGSVDYLANRDEVIASAFELVGVGTEGETLEADDINVASRALNLMVKAWQAHGLQLWKRAEVSVPLTATQNTYTLGRSGTPDVTVDRPLRIYDADRKETSSGTTTSLTRITLEEYESLPNKTTAGLPTQYFFEPTLGNSTLKLWPTPDATAASDYTVELVVQAPLEDMDSGTDGFDFPQYWLEAVVYGLAVRLAPRYGGLNIQDRSMLRKEAKEVLDLAISFDTEEGSIYFGYER